jgi:hypothetical protein
MPDEKKTVAVTMRMDAELRAQVDAARDRAEQLVGVRPALDPFLQHLIRRGLEGQR